MKNEKIINQKIKGLVEKMVGEIEEATGHHVKGKISKAKGKMDETMADIKKRL